MASSVVFIEVRTLIFGLLHLSCLLSDFYQVCGTLHVIIGACISDSLVINVTVPFNKFYHKSAQMGISCKISVLEAS